LKEWQTAEAQLVAAENDMRSAEMSLEAAHARLRIIGFADHEIVELKEKGRIRRAAPVLAPIHGTAVSPRGGPGQFVRNGRGGALYTTADLPTMWLKALVPENETPNTRLGQEVEVKVSALPGRVFRARTPPISAPTDLTPRRTVVRSEVANPD